MSVGQGIAEEVVKMKLISGLKDPEAKLGKDHNKTKQKFLLIK